MKLAIVGLGKMGANMAERLRRGGPRGGGLRPPRRGQRRRARSPSWSRPWATARGSCGAWSRPATSPRQTVTELGGLLSEGDVVVDGGNSNFHDSLRRAEALAASGIGWVDAGTSGGVWGLENGYALMVGGTDDDVAKVWPALEALSPGDGKGLAHVGPPGSGHFTKMVHNGVEYGMMQAYAEGFAILEASDLDIDVRAGLRSWQHGSVVRSWLLDLLVRALEDDPGLADIAPVAADSGEGRWTVEEAIHSGVAAPVISAALFARFVSQDDDDVAMRAIAALRNQFGGHAVQHADDAGRELTVAGVERCDGVVLFGATGDLAAKKLYPALYHIEAAGRLGPVIGVSSSPWSDDELRERARTSIADRVEGADPSAVDALCRNLTYMSGDYRDPATFDGLAEHVAAAGVERPLFFLAIPPSLFDDVVRGLTRVGLARARPRGGGEALRPGPGLGPGAQRLPARRLRRGLGVPHRPLPREGGGGEPAGLPVRQLDARAAVEPELHLPRADHHGRGVRGRLAGEVLRERRRPPRRGPEPPAADRRPPGHGAAGGGRRRRPLRREDPALPPGPVHRPGPGGAGPVPGLPRRGRRPGRLRRGDLRGPALRDRLLALVRRPLGDPHRQGDGRHRDGGDHPLRRPAPPPVHRRRQPRRGAQLPAVPARPRRRGEPAPAGQGPRRASW